MNIFDIIRYKHLKKAAKYYYNNLHFDTSAVDDLVGGYAEKIYKKNRNKFNSFNGYNYKVGFWGTTLYDTGGHTACVVNIANSLNESERNILFLSRLKQSQKKAPKAMKKLENYCNICGVDYKTTNFKDAIIDGYNKILANSPRVFLLYISEVDICSTALIYLLKKTTDIKFIFFNHASHFPNVAMTFADLILEGMPTTEKITHEKRHLYNTKIIGIQSKKEGDTKYYSNTELKKLRQSLGIEDNELMTVSGGTSYKFFDNNSSKYFEMIKNILEKKKNLKHVIMTNLSKVQKNIVENIFQESEVQKRLIIIPLSTEYEKIFQAADLYIDSFPVASAMTQIDLMRLKVAATVKINTENPEWSFHEYMPADYPYMFEKVEDMEEAVLELLHDESKRKEIIEKNYEFWLNNYESKEYKRNIERIIKELINE